MAKVRKVSISINASLNSVDPLEWYQFDDGAPMSIEDIREFVEEDALNYLSESDDSSWDVDVSFVEVDE